MNFFKNTLLYALLLILLVPAGCERKPAETATDPVPEPAAAPDGPPDALPSTLKIEKQAKTYVITGANSGTGFEAARILLSKEATVVMLNRNSGKSEAAIEKLDVPGIEALWDRIDDEYARSLMLYRYAVLQVVLENYAFPGGMMSNGSEIPIS